MTEQLDLFANAPDHALHYGVRPSQAHRTAFFAKCRCGAELPSMTEINEHKAQYDIEDEGPRR